MRCAHCRPSREIGPLEETFAVLREDGGEDIWCAECDADLPRTLRPSLGFVPALLRSINNGEGSELVRGSAEAGASLSRSRVYGAARRDGNDERHAAPTSYSGDGLLRPCETAAQSTTVAACVMTHSQATQPAEAAGPLTCLLLRSINAGETSPPEV